ncbi:TfuA-like protein [Rhizobium skierniewicense]|uniref:TfuA-like protein n=1 Tax=Rhizobium skierniewicense TaxID=984260 RepID=UPI001FAD648B|nr:TfuA-like protein [Rhizobium skierniewicense]MCI9867509.1 TfuA-like protein [Rhizobium skierniewicense]
MKLVFVGPSLPNARDLAPTGIEIRPPACQGDVMQALQDGATSIGLIDGQFATAAPVWHKELLFALSKGIPVFGAASMGALRAAECAAFGMIGIGQIYEDYASGARVDDADVALIYGPAELGYPPLSIPLVNAEATISNMLREGGVNAEQCEALRTAAQRLFFKDRTWKAIAALSGIAVETLDAALKACWVDQKKLDAMALISAIENNVPEMAPRDWDFNATPLFRKMYLNGY